MNARVWMWFSQIPRPQNRQTPRAVFRQCQQSTSVPLLDRVVGGAADSAAMEAAGDELLEGRSIQAEQSRRSLRTHGRRPRDVEQQGDLTEVVSTAEVADSPSVFR